MRILNIAIDCGRLALCFENAVRKDIANAIMPLSGKNRVNGHVASFFGVN